MNIAAILRQIDAEIEKLHTIREILSELSSPHNLNRSASSVVDSKLRTSALRRRPLPPRVNTPAVSPESAKVAENQIVEGGPKLVVLPPKATRTRRYRLTPIQPVTRALSGAFPDKPVFVPKAQPAPSAPVPTPAFDPEALEAAMRRSLLDGHQATAFA